MSNLRLEHGWRMFCRLLDKASVSAVYRNADGQDVPLPASHGMAKLASRLNPITTATGFVHSAVVSYLVKGECPIVVITSHGKVTGIDAGLSPLYMGFSGEKSIVRVWRDRHPWTQWANVEKVNSFADTYGLLHGLGEKYLTDEQQKRYLAVLGIPDTFGNDDPNYESRAERQCEVNCVMPLLASLEQELGEVVGERFSSIQYPSARFVLDLQPQRVFA